MDNRISSQAGGLALRVERFCEVYGVGRTKAFGEIRAGRLKARKVGRSTIIRAEDAKAWLDALPADRPPITQFPGK
jgi:hypothetical protein